MGLPEIRVTKEEMLARVALFKDLKGFDTGLIDSEYPSAYRTLYNALGFQPPRGKGGSEVESPVGDNASKNSAIKISEGFNIGFCECKPGFGPMMHNHDTNETFIPMTGTWRCSWEVDGKIEFFDVEQWDICSFPAGVQRRFENVTFSEPDKNHTLMFVIGGDAPEVDFSAKAKETLRSAGLLK
jgi:mannose-6-phosphate isomerase-like protein (cupin superfamily)